MAGDLSGKFPFAIFGWMGDELDSWDASGTAPSFSVPLPFWDQSLSVDFAVVEPVMPLLRVTIVIVATLLLVWWLATALLGLKEETA